MVKKRVDFSQVAGITSAAAAADRPGEEGGGKVKSVKMNGQTKRARGTDADGRTDGEKAACMSSAVPLPPPACATRLFMEEASDVCPSRPFSGHEEAEEIGSQPPR